MGEISHFDLAPYCRGIEANRNMQTQGVLRLNMSPGCHDQYCNLGAKKVLLRAPSNIVIGSSIGIGCAGCNLNPDGFPETDATVS